MIFVFEVSPFFCRAAKHLDEDRQNAEVIKPTKEYQEVWYEVDRGNDVGQAKQRNDPVAHALLPWGTKPIVDTFLRGGWACIAH